MDRDDPFAPLPRHLLDEIVERMVEEHEVRGRRCPYCGGPDVALHRADHHPEMWIGGPNTYGTAFHGWADH